MESQFSRAALKDNSLETMQALIRRAVQSIHENGAEYAGHARL